MMKLAHARGMSGIPINKVARVYRLHVAGEEDAIKMDALVDEVLPKIKTAAGYDSAARTVCKSEWAYEFTVVFKDLDSFKAYDGSEFREKEIVPVLGKAKEIAVGGELYAGVRVFDAK